MSKKLKDKDYFKFDKDTDIFPIVDKLRKKKEVVVDIVTCYEIKVTWATSKFTKDKILDIINSK